MIITNKKLNLATESRINLKDTRKIDSIPSIAYLEFVNESPRLAEAKDIRNQAFNSRLNLELPTRKIVNLQLNRERIAERSGQKPGKDG